ncbi:DUF1801 domain-containing protein [Marivirga atlantica]|jgi:uncharacterized protein YdhG (YjbR/CyaY superfamily)|uniref:DUF1801 domain-containing protein n=1 Tax=Marivirga atlantica TaxID=1548457 RepID=A0A937AKG5_9BACT|nr:DUF1801 domain-containing protein [Marivirga atlantica]MBL0764367.1 DUF1801 domain-containing protein [Marivirga atlantica]
MQSAAKTPEQYINELPEERRLAVSRLRNILKEKLPEGFKEEMSYGMLGYVVPHELYPKGYHVNPELPLPFINLASQKNFIALYHSGIYASADLLEWFKEEYAKQVPTKLDMGKSCIRFKNIKNIPFDLIAELAEKMTPQQWIELYESKINRA